MRSASVVAGLVSALAIGAASAQSEPAGASTAPVAGLVCLVSGYDVILRNDGTEPIAEGVEVIWSVPFARREGTHTLEAALDPGRMFFLSGALGASFLDSAKPCVIALGEGAEDAISP